MIEAELPDGTVLEFPDDTPQDTIQATVRRTLQLRSGPRRGMEPPPQRVPTLQERGREVYGFEDLAERGNILPIGRTQEGEITAAMPQFLVDMAESVLLPGHAMGGGRYTAEDVLKMVLDWAAPATAARGVGAGRGAMGGGQTRGRQLLREAPTTEQLKQQARRVKGAAVAQGANPTPESYLNLMAEIEDLGYGYRMHPTLQPKSSAAFEILSGQLGKNLDIQDLMTSRRVLQNAQKGASPDLASDRELARQMMERLDDWVDNLSPDDLAVPVDDPQAPGRMLRDFRSLWHRAAKSQEIEEIIEGAGLQASGFENGIRIGFRQLLKDKKRIRGYSPQEKRLMRQIVEGTGGQKMLRLLGKLSFGTRGGSNFLGGSIGTGGGAAAGGAMGGPVGAAIGAVASPAIGYGAQKAADAAAGRSAAIARALAASGGGTVTPTTQSQALAELLMRAGAPVAGTPTTRRQPLVNAPPPPGVI